MPTKFMKRQRCNAVVVKYAERQTDEARRSLESQRKTNEALVAQNAALEKKVIVLEKAARRVHHSAKA